MSIQKNTEYTLLTAKEIFTSIKKEVPSHFYPEHIGDYEEGKLTKALEGGLTGVVYDSCNGGVTTSNWYGRRVRILIDRSNPAVRTKLEVTSYGGFPI